MNNGSQRESLEALKRQIDLVDVIRQCGVELQVQGELFKARCPLPGHTETDASFTVNPKAPRWPLFNCFGCRRGGDVFDFLRLTEGLDFPQALARVKALTGLSLPPMPVASPAPQPPDDPDDLPGGYRRVALLTRVMEFYREALLTNPGAQAYLAHRGLGDPELWRTFGVGFCDGSLLRKLPEAGHQAHAALQQLGVLTKKGYEHFMGFVVIPLMTAEGDVVGLYGRSIQADARVKHLYLRGPHRGILNPPAFKSGAPLYLAESVLDALSIWQAGERSVTALYGAHDTLPVDLEAELGTGRVREVRLCLDADAAGRAATEQLAARLSARGIACTTVTLPEGHDPNAVLVAEGPEVLQHMLTRLDACAGPSMADYSTDVTEDGFLLRTEGIAYQVSPRKPFPKVFIRASAGGATAMDTVNLENQRSRAAFMNQVHHRLAVEKSDVERHLVAILEATQLWEKANRKPEVALESSALVTKKAPPMSDAEREAGLAFLRRPDLMAAILEDARLLGYVGEENNITLVYLIGTSRKLTHPLSGIVVSQSAAGKSTLAEIVELFIPPEDVVFYSRLSPLALVYLPDDYIQQKILVMEERIGGESADLQIRLIQSKGIFKQAVVMKDPQSGQMRTQEKELLGPMAYLETTTSTSINAENASRCFELVMDETPEQTRRIQRQQWHSYNLEALKLKRQREAIRSRHHVAQRLLDPIHVVIPFGHLISFPSQWPRCRRDNRRFSCLLEVIAFLHQHQRPRHWLPADAFGVETPYIEATVEDYRIAYNLARGVLGTTLHELTRHAQELWHEVHRFAALLTKGKRSVLDVGFTRRELRNFTRWADHRLRDALDELVRMEYLSAIGSQGKTYTYQLQCDLETMPSPLSELTTPEELEARWHAEVLQPV